MPGRFRDDLRVRHLGGRYQRHSRRADSTTHEIDSRPFVSIYPELRHGPAEDVRKNPAQPSARSGKSSAGNRGRARQRFVDRQKAAQQPKAQRQTQQQQQLQQGAAQRQQQAPRAQGKDRGPQDKGPAQEPKQGQEKGRDKGEKEGGERNK
jgi:hypothetical protein